MQYLEPSVELNFWMCLVILCMTVITVVTRSFFLFSNQAWTLPHWVQRALQYAPIAALSAVVAPELVLTQGQFITTWQDARLFAALAGAFIFQWRRSVLLTIVGGMGVFLSLRLALGW